MNDDKKGKLVVTKGEWSKAITKKVTASELVKQLDFTTKVVVSHGANIKNK